MLASACVAHMALSSLMSTDQAHLQSLSHHATALQEAGYRVVLILQAPYILGT